MAGTPAPSEIRPAGEDRARTAVFGPFGLRDCVVGGSVFLMLIGSLLPWSTSFDLELNLWSPLTPLFFLGIGIVLPLLVAGLFAARRMAPELKYRIGSLSVDQFGSVVAVLATAFFFLQLVNEFTIGTLLTFIGALGLVASTTLAPHIPPFSHEFAERPETPAHVTARDAVRLQRRPAAPAGPGRPAAAADGDRSGDDAAAADGKSSRSRLAGIGKKAPAGLFGRKPDDAGTTPAPNGIPETGAAAAGASAAPGSDGPARAGTAAAGNVPEEQADARDSAPRGTTRSLPQR
ncbi:hypothetical protein OL239_03420 [Arthrobacter sp. ATA002]|uniref:hypothetical protein n=1 Tax=Arthrobacter sp. ATA002 TaxID=2991715 RepID=UPI0022A6C2B1|nr:hypothetical protein [Arthrobacter sp. ATA002]WAP52344.1 hypothetical protein OL239_03420 [Arthrobacter sp. ATA002]